MSQLNQNQLPFPMKKKSSNAIHIQWMMAFLMAIGIGYLFILIEFVKMYDRKIAFYNLKTTNITNNNSYSNMDKNTPTFIVYEDTVVFGTMDSLILPKLKKDSLVLSKNEFAKEFKSRIENYKNYKILFPSKVVGIAFDPKTNTDSYAKKLELMNDVYSLIEEQNINVSHKEITPSLVFLDTWSSK